MMQGDLRILKTLFNIRATLSLGKLNPDWAVWMLEGPTSSSQYPAVCLFFSLFIVIFLIPLIQCRMNVFWTTSLMILIHRNCSSY